MPIEKKDGFVVVNNIPISCRKISAQTSNWMKRIVLDWAMNTNELSEICEKNLATNEENYKFN